ncbi:hypothetical protein BJ912DRAFT_1003126 [Pholiota molesta]|nr:hypothetical protein BJ912DRAFT_1003126 [Pholiota molesta]
MPRRTERQKNSETLIKTFLQFCQLREKHLRVRRKAHRGQHRRRRTTSPQPDFQVDHDTIGLPAVQDPTCTVNTLLLLPTSDSAGLSTSDVSFTSSSHSSNLFGSTSEDSSECSDDDSSSTSSDDSDSSGSSTDGFFGGLAERGSTGWSLSDTTDSDFAQTNLTNNLVRNLGLFVRKGVEKMYQTRYEKPRQRIHRRPATMREVLDVDKQEHPSEFRNFLRVNPTTFDKMVEQLSIHPVFQNNSPNGQMPIEDQLSIALYRFGHFGNAAGLRKVARWSGYGKGTVLLATRRVMVAILDKRFMDSAVHLPTPAEKEEAKQWVESHSCRKWRDGWCMVDGTLVPLFDRPFCLSSKSTDYRLRLWIHRKHS